MKVTKIKGKDYIEVNERVKHFRSNPKFENYGVNTEIISHNDDYSVVIMKATITNPEGAILSTGTAMEDQTSSYINKTSHIENCETSAVGRALGFLGIGIDTSIGSADEVDMAIAKQNRPKLTEEQFLATIKGTKEKAQNVLGRFEVESKYKKQIIQKFKI